MFAASVGSAARVLFGATDGEPRPRVVRFEKPLPAVAWTAQQKREQACEWSDNDGRTPEYT